MTVVIDELSNFVKPAEKYMAAHSELLKKPKKQDAAKEVKK